MLPVGWGSLRLERCKGRRFKFGGAGHRRLKNGVSGVFAEMSTLDGDYYFSLLILCEFVNGGSNWQLDRVRKRLVTVL